MGRTVKIEDKIIVAIFKENDGTVGVDINSDNIQYCLQEIGENVKTGEMVQMEGLQINDYSKNDEIRDLCREIADKCKILMEKLPKNQVKG